MHTHAEGEWETEIFHQTWLGKCSPLSGSAWEAQKTDIFLNLFALKISFSLQTEKKSPRLGMSRTIGCIRWNLINWSFDWESRIETDKKTAFIHLAKQNTRQLARQSIRGYARSADTGRRRRNWPSNHGGSAAGCSHRLSLPSSRLSRLPPSTDPAKFNWKVLKEQSLICISTRFGRGRGQFYRKVRSWHTYIMKRKSGPKNALAQETLQAHFAPLLVTVGDGLQNFVDDVASLLSCEEFLRFLIEAVTAIDVNRYQMICVNKWNVLEWRKEVYS